MTLSKKLLLASFTGTYAETMLLPLWSTWTDKVGGSIMDAGVGFALFSMFTGLAVIAAGSTKFFEDNAKWFLCVGFAIAGIGDLLYLLVQNKYELFIVQSLIGISIGLANPAWDALYTEDEVNGHSAAKKWSFWTGGVSFVTGVAALTGSLIVTYFGFHTLFVGMFVFDLASIWFAYQIARDTKKVDKSPQNRFCSERMNKHAQALGRMAKGKPKKFSRAYRKVLAQRLREAQAFQAKGNPKC